MVGGCGRVWGWQKIWTFILLTSFQYGIAYYRSMICISISKYGIPYHKNTKRNYCRIPWWLDILTLAFPGFAIKYKNLLRIIRTNWRDSNPLPGGSISVHRNIVPCTRCPSVLCREGYSTGGLSGLFCFVSQVRRKLCHFLNLHNWSVFWEGQMLPDGLKHFCQSQLWDKQEDWY